MLALTAALVLSQTIYTWVDKKGVTHFTDGATGIPADAQKTTGDPISVVPRTRLPPRPPEPVAAPRPVVVQAPAPAPAPKIVVVSEPVVVPQPIWVAPHEHHRRGTAVVEEPSPAPTPEPVKPKPAPTVTRGRF